MKILALSASPRGEKSGTLQLVKAVLAGAKAAGADVELVDVCKLKVNYCTGCGACYATGACPHQDDFAALQKKMLAADGLVLGSPNYFRSVSAQMKTCLDRLADAVHCQRFTGKYGCAVATAGAPASKEVTDYLNGILVALGANAVGAAGAAPAIPGAMEAAEKEATELGKRLAEAIQSQRTYPEQEAMHREFRNRFKHLVSMNKDLWKHEYEHWRGLGEL